MVDNPPLTDVAPDQPVFILCRNVCIKIFGFPCVRLTDLGGRDESAIGINNLDDLQDVFLYDIWVLSQIFRHLRLNPIRNIFHRHILPGGNVCMEDIKLQVMLPDQFGVYKSQRIFIRGAFYQKQDNLFSHGHLPSRPGASPVPSHRYWFRHIVSPSDRPA